MNSDLDTRLASLAAAALQRHAALELESITIAANDPTNAVPVARAAGVTPAMFAEPDLHLLWCALLVSEQGGEFLRTARNGLKRIGHWDGSQTRANWPLSGLWSADSLSALASHFHPTPTPVAAWAITSVARELVDVHQRLVDVHQCHDYAVGLLVALAERSAA